MSFLGRLARPFQTQPSSSFPKPHLPWVTHHCIAASPETHPLLKALFRGLSHPERLAQPPHQPLLCSSVLCGRRCPAALKTSAHRGVVCSTPSPDSQDSPALRLPLPLNPQFWARCLEYKCMPNSLEEQTACKRLQTDPRVTSPGRRVRSADTETSVSRHSPCLHEYASLSTSIMS